MQNIMRNAQQIREPEEIIASDTKAHKLFGSGEIHVKEA